MQFTTLSTYNVELMLASVNRMAYWVVNADEMTVPDTQGMELAYAIIQKIADCCTNIPSYDDEIIELKEEYQGFPEDLGLPAGSARVEWDAEQGKYVIPETHAYGTTINVSSLSDYVYPMSLEYQVISDILASNELIIQPDPENNPDEYNTFDDWSTVINEYNEKNAGKRVENSTQSVVMVNKVDYAVGRMAVDHVSKLSYGFGKHLLEGRNHVRGCPRSAHHTGALTPDRHGCFHHPQPHGRLPAPRSLRGSGPLALSLRHALSLLPTEIRAEGDREDLPGDTQRDQQEALRGPRDAGTAPRGV